MTKFEMTKFEKMILATVRCKPNRLLYHAGGKHPMTSITAEDIVAVRAEQRNADEKIFYEIIFIFDETSDRVIHLASELRDGQSHGLMYAAYKEQDNPYSNDISALICYCSIACNVIYRSFDRSVKRKDREQSYLLLLAEEILERKLESVDELKLELMLRGAATEDLLL